jgi:hypothetical protein
VQHSELVIVVTERDDEFVKLEVGGSMLVVVDSELVKVEVKEKLDRLEYDVDIIDVPVVFPLVEDVIAVTELELPAWPEFWSPTYKTPLMTTAKTRPAIKTLRSIGSLYSAIWRDLWNSVAPSSS